jgi:hypothetical protein
VGNSELNWAGLLAASGERAAAEVLRTAMEAVASRSGAGQASVPVSAALEQLLAADQAQARAITESTEAVVATTTRAAGGGGSGSTAKSILSTLFGSALGATPLIRGLVKLFGGGGGGAEEMTASYNVYTAPEPLAFEGAVDRRAGVTRWSVPEPTGGGQRESVTMPQVTVQVSAMDSRSFLDHSDEIARAVRQAMHHSHGLNDVVGEL